MRWHGKQIGDSQQASIEIEPMAEIIVCENRKSLDFSHLIQLNSIWYKWAHFYEYIK